MCVRLAPARSRLVASEWRAWRGTRRPMSRSSIQHLKPLWNQWDSPGMRLYLSSFRLGVTPSFWPSSPVREARVAVIANAMDFAAEDVRREAVDRELRAMSGLGFWPYGLRALRGPGRWRGAGW
jgi:hypothetical protein